MRLCACGCGEDLTLGGSYRRGHSMARPIAPRYLVDENGCWVWQRNRSVQGYAMVWRHGRNVLAHRIYYASRYGECPPTLDHLCRNRACVNPEHMEPCGRGENVRRGDVAILDWEQVTEIRDAARFIQGSQRAQARQLAPLYGVAEGTLRNVLMGKRWPEAERPAVAA